MDPAHLVHAAASPPPQALGLHGSPTAVQQLYQDLSFCFGAQESRMVAPGYSRGVNRAVLEAFGENLIPSLFPLDRLPAFLSRWSLPAVPKPAAAPSGV